MHTNLTTRKSHDETWLVQRAVVQMKLSVSSSLHHVGGSAFPTGTKRGDSKFRIAPLQLDLIW